MALNLNKIQLRMSAGRPDQFPGDPIPQVAFSGRSNVGKSSLINLLLSRKALARVSSAPGKTVTVNFYEIDRALFFVDLPGYGFAKRAPSEKEQWSRLTDGFFTGNKNRDRIKLVIQLIDSRVGPTADDEMMLNYLTEVGFPFIIVATKADKLNATERRASEEKLRNHPAIPTDTPIVFSSALKSTGREEVWKQITYHTGIHL